MKQKLKFFFETIAAFDLLYLVNSSIDLSMVVVSVA